ncbi:MAG: lipopolysaccharide biosynthesis protein [Clostridia bacterium]|nr:lipopolysaccharide biosynthesis protein [Clostridia bacterium]
MINLLYCGNSGVFDGVLTSLLSILKRSELNEPLNVYIFTMDLSYLDEKYVPINDRQTEIILDVLHTYSPESKITKIDVTEIYREEFSGSPNEDAYCSPYTLIRLLADRIPEIPDKLLYIDADVMFNRDVNLLYGIDVEGVEYAAARDHYGKYLVNPNYINAGVLLLNMKKIRESGLFTRARALLRKKKLVFADQSAIIRETRSKKVLPQRFNDQKFLHPHTVVRHFSKRLFYFPYPHTENVKQWQVSRIHKIFGYYCFDDILYEYIYLKQKYEREMTFK